VGELLGFNTLEAFQKVDKNRIIHEFFVPKFLSGNPECLASVLLLTFADLKSHKVLYWFAFPALMTRKGVSIRVMHQEKLSDTFSNLPANLDVLRRSLFTNGYKGLPPYFIFTRNLCLPLSIESYLSLKSNCAIDEDIIFGFFDPAGKVNNLQSEQPMGWPMRNLLAFLCFHLNLGGEVVRILSYRAPALRRVTSEDTFGQNLATPDDGIILKVAVPTKSDYEFDEGSDNDKYKVVGWELNARCKPGPRWVNLRPLLDSKHLAIQAADLNLKLMKWRMIPSLQVEMLQATKVLIVGAGTLGCSVARTLLGWGVRHFKFVDYGKVNYSNPVRQNLFTLDDCAADNGSGRPKAAAAAEALCTIAADVDAEGVTISIPMPGHVETFESVQASVDALDSLVQEADAIFLLTDTRESRWLPTVMAASHNKVLINAALGLDSWLVMRHGGGECANLQRLGCYFCNDVVAPENSTRNRTLDQQCTVTRPGLAPIASSMAVEMLVSLLHHPGRLSAPAAASGTSQFSPTVPQDSQSSPLGVIPHQIRGSLVSYSMMTPSVPAFKHCTACAASILDAYKKDGVEFVFQTCQAADSSFLDNISGLTLFRAHAAEMIAQMDEAVDWGEDDE
jgi:ubiquitin-like modifier-activating enzyme ATG7